MATTKTELKLRPQTLSEYVGQGAIKGNLSTFIQAARLREEPLDHVLLYGPPGIGKTSLANVIANELGKHFTVLSGPAVGKPTDLVDILTTIQEGDVVFIDEIHRMNIKVEESIYTALEDFRIDIITKDEGAVNIQLPKFTLIGATTQMGKISSPLRRRFRISFHVDFYTLEELCALVVRTASVYGLVMDEEAVVEIAKRGRGTPAVTNTLLIRVRDFAQVRTNGYVNKFIALASFDELGIDEYGLSSVERKYLNIIRKQFNGGPVGLNTLATAMFEDEDMISGEYEPFLVRSGLLARTGQGREITKRAKEHLQFIDMKQKAGMSLNHMSP